MAAMTRSRFYAERDGDYSTAPTKAGATFHEGALVAMEAGWAVPGYSAPNLVVLGIASEAVANSGANGTKRVLAKRGTFKFFNHGADFVTDAELGGDCYIVDDQTVAKTSAADTRSVAGKVIDVEEDGVWVRVGF